MGTNQIPREIYYCWFGKNPKSKRMKRCIRSWKKFLPDYNIHEINEDNYDLNRKPSYVQQAYTAKKWAFVSDYARFDVLYHQGGVYFDTDVQIIRPMVEILQKGSYMGCERDGNGITEIFVAPGLGMAAVPGLQIYKEILDTYENDCFISDDVSMNQNTVVVRTTNVLKQHGLKNIAEVQTVDGITIYPTSFFCPNLRWYVELFQWHETALTIHWFDASWWSDEKKRNEKIRKRKVKINRIKSFLIKKRCFAKK